MLAFVEVLGQMGLGPEDLGYDPDGIEPRGPLHAGVVLGGFAIAMLLIGAAYSLRKDAFAGGRPAVFGIVASIPLMIGIWFFWPLSFGSWPAFFGWWATTFILAWIAGSWADHVVKQDETIRTLGNKWTGAEQVAEKLKKELADREDYYVLQGENEMFREALNIKNPGRLMGPDILEALRSEAARFRTEELVNSDEVLKALREENLLFREMLTFSPDERVCRPGILMGLHDSYERFKAAIENGKKD